MGTLLLRLAGPLQAWGTDSLFDTRRTGKEPSKSGVIGLLAAAVGIRRDEPLDEFFGDLRKLRFGVRVDKEGELLYDYHTQMINGKIPTYRYYLSDATFLVGLESEDDAWLELLQQALLHPAYPLFLGRRSCVPVLPLVVGIRRTDLVTSLTEEPWQISEWMQKKEKKKGHVMLRLITDAPLENPGAAVQKDLPVSYHPNNRRYAYRPVTELQPVIIEDFSADHTAHDAMSEL